MFDGDPSAMAPALLIATGSAIACVQFQTAPPSDTNTRSVRLDAAANTPQPVPRPGWLDWH
jgi:hypothetical protein